MVACEHSFGKVNEVISRLESYVQEKGMEGERADIVERGILDLLLELGHSFLESFFQLAGDGDVGETLEQGGKVLKKQGSNVRKYHSIFGVVEVSRCVYAARAKQKEYAPLDRDLGLPAVEHSYVLQDWLTRFCVKNSFDDTVDSLRSLLNIKVSKRTAEKTNEDLGSYVEPFRESQPINFEDDEEVLVVSADGKGVPMRSTLEARNGLPETAWQRCHRKKQEKKAVGRAKRRLARGQVKSRKQMAYVGAVYTTKSWVRTSDHVLSEVIEKTSTDRPRPKNKRVQAVMSNYFEGEHVNGQEVLFADFAKQVQQRDPTSKMKLVCLMDGQRSLWNMQRQYLPHAVEIVDIFHVSERLWEAAYCFHQQSSIEAEEMVCHYFKLLLDGKVDTVIRSLRGKLRLLTSTKHKILSGIIKYYDNNRPYMKYDEYLKQGYPIGSGAIEGTCRHLVKDRMERTGMRWEIEGAQAMLNTRSSYINDEWNELIEFRIKRQQECLSGQAA